jgi:hypothetical protein
MAAKRTILAATMMLVLTAACASGGEFRSLCSAVGSELGAKRQWIPFMGLARTGVRMIKPHGVHDVRLAIYQHPNGLSGANPRLDAAIARITDQGWAPLVRVTEAGGSRTTVWIRPEGDLMDMLVLAHDHEESVLVHLRVDSEKLLADLAESPLGVAKRRSVTD